MTLKEYLEKADEEIILHIGSGNSFFFVGPKGEFKPEDIDTFFKDEAKRRCENYVKYISRSLERVFSEGLKEEAKTVIPQENQRTFATDPVKRDIPARLYSCDREGGQRSIQKDTRRRDRRDRRGNGVWTILG